LIGSLHQGFPLLLLSYHYTTHIHNMTTHSTSSSITLTEANPPSKQSPQVKDADAEAPNQEPSPDIAPAPQLSWARKHILLALFAMISMYLRSSNELSSLGQATIVDICNISGARMAVSPVTHDLDLPPSQGVWVINAYVSAFAAFQLVAGRFADTFQVQILFILVLSAWVLSVLLHRSSPTNTHSSRPFAMAKAQMPSRSVKFSLDGVVRGRLHPSVGQSRSNHHQVT